jgi:uncharacterized protein
MLKFIIVGVAVALLLWWLFGRAPRKTTMRPRTPRSEGAEAMVACAHCGVHLPRGDAVGARGLHYCSPAHRDAPPDH